MLELDLNALVGTRVRLEPLATSHAAALAAASAGDRSSYRYTPVPDGMDGEHGAVVYIEDILKRQAKKELIPFVQVRVSDGEVVGTTRVEKFRAYPKDGPIFAAEIGGTWLAQSAQGEGFYPEARLLVMTQLFEVHNLERVDFGTDDRNVQSKRALEKMGATPEGVLRNWQASFVRGEEGRLRNTAVYSITSEEWPMVRAGLTARLGAGRGLPITQLAVFKSSGCPPTF